MAIADEQSAEDNRTGSPAEERQRKRRKLEGDAPVLGMGQSLSSIENPKSPESSLTQARPASRESADSGENEVTDSQEWQTVESGRSATKKGKKVPKKQSQNYPAIDFVKTSKLQAQIKISDLQGLVLYILTDSQAPRFVSVRNRLEIRRVVVLMVPGLERSMFLKKAAGVDEKAEQKNGGQGGDHERLQQEIPNWTNPDHYFPKKLEDMDLNETLQPFADMFELMWPVTTPGDTKYGQMHSPLHAMLTAPLSQTKADQKGARPAKEPHGWQNKRTTITEFIHSPEELLENEYVIHPASYSTQAEKDALKTARKAANQSVEDGWVDTLVDDFDDGTVPDKEIESGSLTAGREILAMDCEMCKTGDNEFSLTRISLVSWDGTVVLDELVKPEKPIIDYLTM